LDARDCQRRAEQPTIVGCRDVRATLVAGMVPAVVGRERSAS
jgi:hypothetical protein